MPIPRSLLPCLGVVLIALSIGKSALALDYFVDNQIGDNINDGRFPELVDALSGPVKSISRALKYARAGDVVHIANRGIPYFESLEMVGARFSQGFTIDGNGAVVSGARPIPYNVWKSLGNEVWRFTPHRKAFYQLIKGESSLPEQPCPPGAAQLPEIIPGHWCAWRGSIYYRVLPGEAPIRGSEPFFFAAEEVGITLLDASEVTIHNLELRHFRLDGVNVHDRCQHIILDSVRLIENGRAGLAVGGSSLVGLKDSTLERNRFAQLVNTEVAQTEVLTSQIGPNPDVMGLGPSIRIKGGHVLVDHEEFREAAEPILPRAEPPAPKP